MSKTDQIRVRQLAGEDCVALASAFGAQNWNKPVHLFEQYLNECSTGERTVLLAEVGREFAGYATVDWHPNYPLFTSGSIPEIADLNVLIRFQRRGVGTALMDSAEGLISERSDTVGIRVGLNADYGNAQRIYAKRGYIPDGHGIWQRGRFAKYGDVVKVDNDLTLAFTKTLK
jgi:GNAT superfamily N-acetyltransferase